MPFNFKYSPRPNPAWLKIDPFLQEIPSSISGEKLELQNEVNKFHLHDTPPLRKELTVIGEKQNKIPSAKRVDMTVDVTSVVRATTVTITVATRLLWLWPRLVAPYFYGSGFRTLAVSLSV
ncbi:hypothetical protein J6590_038031 [Homalodisca vitripennis]|nr:hypothetical protein J6590_038031 [Homalodisca vitripennis]